ncbi:MAG: hypothetical protein V4695_06980 [Pseudomonadota bacterium]
MNEALSNDEYDALGQIADSAHSAHNAATTRPSACVARNVKRLAGLKFVVYGKDGRLSVTEKGAQTLFIRRCIDGLRAVAQNPAATLAVDVQTFLSKKGHLVPSQTGGYLLTQRGTESLADIDITAR